MLRRWWLQRGSPAAAEVRRVPWWGVVFAAAAPVLLVTGWTVAAGLQPRSFDAIAGATSLIADMSATISCDYAGADAVVRACRRAILTGTELRLVVTAQIVRRVLSTSGLDRLVAIYPSLESAAAARARGSQAGVNTGGRAMAEIPGAGKRPEQEPLLSQQRRRRTAASSSGRHPVSSAIGRR
jgi:anti-anti-sigma regulatory factor